MRRKTVLRLGLAGLVGLLALGGKCRLFTQPDPPTARLVRVTYTRPAEIINPAWCSEWGRSSPNNVLSLGEMPEDNLRPDEIHLGPPDVLVWHRSLGDRRFAREITMGFTEPCVPQGVFCLTGHNLEPEVEVPPGYRVEREVVESYPCGGWGYMARHSYLRLRLVREE